MRTFLLYGRVEELFADDFTLPTIWSSDPTTEEGDRGLMYVIEHGILYEWVAFRKRREYRYHGKCSAFPHSDWIQQGKNWETGSWWRFAREFSNLLTCKQMKTLFTYREWPEVHHNLHV